MSYKDEYPYALDGPLCEALGIALKNGDTFMARGIQLLMKEYKGSAPYSWRHDGMMTTARDVKPDEVLRP